MRKNYNRRDEPVGEIDIEQTWMYTSMANTMEYVLIDNGYGVLEAVHVDQSSFKEQSNIDFVEALRRNFFGD